MRLQVEVTTRAREIPWREVLRPGRGIVYSLLSETAPELGASLHDRGWGRYGMVPFGHSAPRFPAVRGRRGVYAAGGAGTVEFSSPLTEVAHALAAGLAGVRVLDWGGVALQVGRVVPVFPPLFSDGSAVLRSVTPVVVKGPPGRDDDGKRVRSQRWLLPGEPEWDVYFVQNLRRKAETLGLDPAVELESVTRVGPKRSFAVGAGAKVGAEVDVELSGPPTTLQALWSWGLGAATSAGFGAVLP
ncbi:CRISPR-associated endoribonuclease Cas6 [Saccharopolyspora spinosa]|uniref:CRISPR-associated endoribonuclease Cas6 n=1 Tax=Saccharopolyspora spinosa TaxID=60894 RepID=A0A2N3Y799_SACSN|nr:CRISPR-associated endoribonuclease Cas6 [Saccharopolyspora spinosa]PKW18797.1 CRISPR-associated endoribonuclease Cas6 [Saccharopolyspora spinosa]